MSSMCSAVSANSSLTSMPLWPYLLELERRGERGAGLALGRAGAFGSGLPAYFASAGLGSNVSTCDGPPFMKRWMTRFALPGKCGRFGAIGPARRVLAGGRARRSRRAAPRRPRRAEAQGRPLQQARGGSAGRIAERVRHGPHGGPPVVNRRNRTRSPSARPGRAAPRATSRRTGPSPNSALALQAVAGSPGRRDLGDDRAQVNWSLLSEPRRSTTKSSVSPARTSSDRHVEGRPASCARRPSGPGRGGCSRSTRGPRRPAATSWISVELDRDRGVGRGGPAPDDGVVEVVPRVPAGRESDRAQPRPLSGQLGPPCHSLPVKCGSGRKSGQPPAPPRRTRRSRTTRPTAGRRDQRLGLRGLHDRSTARSSLLAASAAADRRGGRAGATFSLGRRGRARRPGDAASGRARSSGERVVEEEEGLLRHRGLVPLRDVQVGVGEVERCGRRRRGTRDRPVRRPSAGASTASRAARPAAPERGVELARDGEAARRAISSKSRAGGRSSARAAVLGIARPAARVRSSDDCRYVDESMISRCSDFRLQPSATKRRPASRAARDGSAARCAGAEVARRARPAPRRSGAARSG